MPAPRYHRFSIAPMMDWSDRHCRYFWRLLTQHSLLYTEMVVSAALVHGDKRRFLKHSEQEYPLALQVGGNDPKELSKCAQMAEEWGYSEINLNCGCPSDRVQSGKIGAVLMREPEVVARCVEAMRSACSIPVTVKHRIGIDDMEDYTDLKKFVDIVADAGCSTFIVHARKAWLKGLSPKENREIPPLQYDLVYKLKQELPKLTIVINGGITTTQQSTALLEHLDGVMIGREAYHNPYFLHEVDQAVFASTTASISRAQVMQAFIDYCDQQLASEPLLRLHHMSRHILGLYQGQANARLFRRFITENANKPGATTQVLRDALSIVEG